MVRFKAFIYVYISVISCVVFGAASYITIFFPGESPSVNILWQILFVSFMCSVWTLLYPTRELSKKGMLILNLVHYSLVNIVVLGCGLWFEWFDTDNLPQVFGMLVLIAIIFAIVAGTTWKREAQVAYLMNERLREYQEKQEMNEGI